MQKSKEQVLRTKMHQAQNFKVKSKELEKKMNSEKDFNKKEILKLRMEIQLLKFHQKIKECQLIQKSGR